MRIGTRVRIVSGMSEFVGQTGEVVSTTCGPTTTSARAREHETRSGEAWVRKRDRFIVDVERVTRTKVTIVERMQLLVYDYTPVQFALYFRPARGPVAPTDTIEPR